MKHLNEFEIWNYLEDKLSEDESKNVREHLTQCEECSYQLRVSGTILRELMDNKSPRLTSSFINRVLSELNLVKKQKTRLSFITFPFILFGIFSIFIIGTIIIFYIHSPQNFDQVYLFDSYLKDFINTWEAGIKKFLLGLKLFSEVTYLYIIGSVFLIGIVEVILSKFSFRKR